MCTAALAIAGAGLALSAGGTLYSASQQAGYANRANKAEQDRQAASNAARVAELNRQKEFQAKGMQDWQKQLEAQGAGDVQTQVNTGRQEALETVDKVRTESNLEQGLLPGQAGGTVSDVFTKDVAARTADRLGDAKKRIDALATLSGFDRANGYSRLSGQRFNADQGILQGLQKASLGLGRQEGDVPGAFVGSPNNLGSAATTLGNFGLAFAPNYKANIDSIANIFSPPPVAAPAAPPLPAIY